MPNIKTIIGSHNRTILSKDNIVSKKNCNCVNKSACPLFNKCLSNNIVYQATVCSDKPEYKEKVYIGSSATTFKFRCANHLKSFNTNRYKNDTELSKEVWELKESNFIPFIKWKVIRRCRPYNLASKICSLCLNEKLEILFYKGMNLLNKRGEMVSMCRHKNKFLLSSYDTGD